MEELNDSNTNPAALVNLGSPIDSMQTQPRPVRIQFTGKGADYFPIWIVNILLIVVTLGMYRPWAKVRREKFFHQHTVIDRDSLDYHGDPKSILVGQLVSMGLILLVYARTFSVTLAAGAAVVLCLIVPFAMQRSLRFRLYNTSFRGLRFGFKGTVKRAYMLAMIPVAIIGITFFNSRRFGRRGARQNASLVLYSNGTGGVCGSGGSCCLASLRH